jgi:hypothetical protein
MIYELPSAREVLSGAKTRAMIETLKERIPLLRELMRSCTLCPRECRVNRLEGETGFCGLGPGAVLARALPHFGEDLPSPGLQELAPLFTLQPAVPSARIPDKPRQWQRRWTGRPGGHV